jgi:hypothetical protein
MLIKAQHAAAADPRSRSHRTGSAPALIARGAGLSQGSKRKRRIAFENFLLKWSLHSGRGQAAPASPGEAGAGLSRQPLGGLAEKGNT